MADFRTRTEMGSERDFIQALESLVSGNANTDSSWAGTYVTGINRPLGRLSRNADALLDAVQTAKNCILDPIASDVTLEYTTDNKLKMEGTDGIYIRMANNVEAGVKNLIAPGAALVSGLSAGNVLYVQLNRAADATITIASKADWGAYVADSKGQANRLNWLVFGVVTAAETLVLFNGTTIRKGQRLENGLATDTQYASRFNVQQNANIFLTGGGDISFDTSAGTQLTLSAPLLIMSPGGGAGKGGVTINAGSYTVDDGQALYITDLNRTDTVGSVTPTSGALDAISITNTVRDLFVVAYRSGAVLYLANGASIQDGETYRLISSPVYALEVPDETSGSVTDLDGTLTLKKAAGTVVEGSASSSHIRIRNRRDNLQVSIGTTLAWNSSTGVLTFGSSSAANGIKVQHPDYGTASAELANFINPGSTLTIPDGECAYVNLVAVTSSDQAHTTVTSGSGTSPGIYVDEIEDVSESDNDIFIFAYRIGTKLYLWDGTFLEGDGGGSPEVDLGLNPDRALLGMQYGYRHTDIVFKFDKGAAKVTVSWTKKIELLWPSGGVTEINTSPSGLELTSGNPVIRVRVPLADRGPSSSTTVTASTGTHASVNRVSDVVLFAGYVGYRATFTGLFPWEGTSAGFSANVPVWVFGGRRVHQNYEVSGGANATNSGNTTLGEYSILGQQGRTHIDGGLYKSSYPDEDNPFLTSKHDGDVRVGSYAATAKYGSSTPSTPTFDEKYSVTGATGATASKSTSQATDFNFGTSAGAVQTKKRVIFLSALDIFRQLEGNDSTLYTSDEGTNTVDPTVAILKHSSSSGALGTAGSVGPGMHALVLVTAKKIRFPVMIPVGCTLSQVTLFWDLDAAASGCFLRVSRSNQIENTLSTGSSYTEGELDSLLTNGSSSVTKSGEDFVDPSSTSLAGPVKRAIYSFSDNTVLDTTDAVAVAAKTMGSPLHRLYVAVMHETGSNAHLIGISVEYTASSVAALLGIENA